MLVYTYLPYSNQLNNSEPSLQPLKMMLLPIFQNFFVLQLDNIFIDSEGLICFLMKYDGNKYII